MSTRLRLLAVTELPVGASRRIETAEGCLALFHTQDGFFALDDACPHRGASLAQGFIKDQSIACPLHQWTFSLETGVCATHSVSVCRHRVEVDEGIVWLLPAR